MILKKKNLIKQVKNFTLNFGPQHPAAHVRRYVQITRYEYLILLFLYKPFRIYNNKVNYYLDNTQTNNIVYLGSNHRQFRYFVLFTGILLVRLTKMNSYFKNVLFKNNIQIFLVYIKKLCMSIIFFLIQTMHYRENLLLLEYCCLKALLFLIWLKTETF